MQAFRSLLCTTGRIPSPYSSFQLTFRTYATNRITLTSIGPVPASQHNQKRLGRGQGTGRGGTSTKGHKGQNARAGNGKPYPGFEGGQTPITRRFPKRGFFNQNCKTFAPVNLDRLQHWIDIGRLSFSRENPITARELLLSGCVHDVQDGIKVLADGAVHLRTPIHIEVSRASQTAIRAIEQAGGSVVCKFYNVLALRDLVHGRTDRKSADPTRKPDMLWYANWKNRGYLSPQHAQRMAARERRAARSIPEASAVEA